MARRAASVNPGPLPTALSDQPAAMTVHADREVLSI